MPHHKVSVDADTYAVLIAMADTANAIATSGKTPGEPSVGVLLRELVKRKWLLDEIVVVAAEPDTCSVCAHNALLPDGSARCTNESSLSYGTAPSDTCEFGKRARFVRCPR